MLSLHLLRAMMQSRATQHSRATHRILCRRTFAAVAVVSLLSVADLSAQAAGERRRNIPVDPVMRDSVVRTTARLVRRNYADSSAGERMGRAIEARWRRGEYAKVDSAAALVEMLSTHLREVRADQHLRLDYFVVARPMRAAAGAPSAEDLTARQKISARRGFGIERVTRMPGNVALIALRSFEPPAFATPVLAAAMQLVNTADALIIDLRQNGGGYGETVGELAAYFLPGATPGSELYDRPSGRTERMMTRAAPAGPRFLQKPLLILTSRRTFSAAEGFAYMMQARGLATVVGETTRGGANPVQVFQISPNFAIFLPTGRVTDAVTGSNWEGVGVKPDEPVDAAGAEAAAYRKALELLIKRTTDTDTLDELRDALERVNASASSPSPATGTRAEFPGEIHELQRGTEPS